MKVEEEEKEDVEEEDAQLIEERVKEIELLKKQVYDLCGHCYL